MGELNKFQKGGSETNFQNLLSKHKFISKTSNFIKETRKRTCAVMLSTVIVMHTFLPTAGLIVQNYSLAGVSYAATAQDSMGDSSLGAEAEADSDDATAETEAIEISTAKQLLNFAKEVNNGKDYSNYIITLTKDIDLSSICSKSSGKSWTPIGKSADHPFKGTFNGNGKTISGLYINNDVNVAGLFGYNEGTIKNLTVSGAISVNENQTSRVGGISAENSDEGIINNCINNVNITVKGNTTATDYSNTVGGITSMNYGTISCCTNEGKVDVQDQNGIVNDYVGGIVGSCRGGTVKDCTNAAEVSVAQNSDKNRVYAGGIAGVAAERSKIKNSGNRGNITVIGKSAVKSVGGVVGTIANSVVNKVYNTGKITGENSENTNYVGGISGWCSNNGTIKNSYNMGEISSIKEEGKIKNIGGIAGALGSGDNKGVITNCYNIGSVHSAKATDETNVGSIVGKLLCDKSSITYSYYLNGKVSGDGNQNDGDEAVGNYKSAASKAERDTISMTAEDMKSQNFAYQLMGNSQKSNVWKYDANQNDGYPSLVNEQPIKLIIDGIIYEIDDDDAIVIGYEGSSGVISIPTKVEDAEVTEIAENAFMGKDITQVTIPASVTRIGKQAFRNCTSLTKVIFDKDSKIENISTRMFAGCTKLSSISLPSTVTHIRKSAFRKCYALTEIKIPNAVTYIGITAFAECTSLQKVTISANSKLKRIRQGAFQGDTALVNIGGPKSFEGDIPLNKMPDSLNGASALEAGVFKGCTALKSISLNVTTIPDSAFENCTALKRVHTRTSKNVKVGESAFAGCTKLVSVYARLSQIGNKAFENCSSLNRITVSTKVAIGKNAKISNIFKNHKDDFKVYAKDNTPKSIFGDLLTIDNEMKGVTVSSKKSGNNEDGTNKSIAVTITGKENLYPLEGWDISADRKTLTKVFTSYVESDTNVNVEDTAGNTVQETLDLNGLAKLNPQITVDFDKSTDYVNTIVNTSISVTTFQKTTLKKLTIGTVLDSGTVTTEIPIKDIELKDGKYVYNTTMDNGKYIIKATDSAGNKKTYNLDINFVDKEDPEVTNVETSVGYLSFDINEANIESVVLVNKYNSNQKTLYYTQTGENKYSVKNHKISTAGDYKVIVTDRAGNKTEKDIGYISVEIQIGIFKVTYTQDEDIVITGVADDYKDRLLIIPNKLDHLGTKNDVIRVEQINNKYIQKIIVEDQVKTIDGTAFFGCSALKNLIIANKNVTMGELQESDKQTTEYTKFKNNVRVVSYQDGAAIEWAKSNGFRTAVILNDGIIYELNENDKTASVCGMYPEPTEDFEVNISSKILSNTYTVTSIGDNAFANSRIYGISFPETVTKIGNNAFYGCKELTDIDLSTIQEIGDSAFACAFPEDGDMGTFSTIDLSSCTKIGSEAFWSANMKKVVGLKVATGHMFEYCKNLTSVSFDDSVESIIIEPSVFNDCINLKEVNIGDNLKSIGEYAFSDCKNLENIYLGINLEEIGYWAFAGTSLKDITINSAAKLCVGSFANLLNDSKITIANNNVTYEHNDVYPYGMGAMGVFGNKNYNVNVYYSAGNTNAEEYGNYVKEIAQNSEAEYEANKYAENVSFTKVQTTPDGKWDYTTEKIKVQEPEESTTDNDGDDEEFTTPTNVEDKEKEIATIIKYNGDDEDVEIPDVIDDYDVGKIDKEAFKNKEGIETIIIPRNVYIIENDIFSGCINLKKVIFQNDGIDLKNNTADLFKDCQNVIIYAGVASNAHIWAERYWTGKYRLISDNVVYGDIDEEQNTASAIGTMFEQRNIEVPGTIGSGDYTYRIKKINKDAFANSSTLENVFIIDATVQMEDGIFSDGTDIVIYCWRDSTAHKYAQDNQIRFYFLEAGMDAVAIEFDSAAIQLKIGEEESLTYRIYPSIAKQNVVWTSSNENVATVENGLVTGIANGVVTITVSATNNPEVSATCEVTVGTGEEEEQYILGDTNGDGKVTTIDKFYMTRHMYAKNNNVHSEWILKGVRLKAANINGDKSSDGDEEINTQDKLQLAKYLAAKYDTVIADRHPDWKTLPNGKE